MKLKSCFLVTLMVCIMFSCSNDDVPGVKTITASVPNATLELAAQTKSRGTKASDADAQGRTTWDYEVKNMTVAVFNKGAYTDNGVTDGRLVAVFTQSFSGKQDSYEVSGMGLQDGQVDVLVLANLSEKNQQKIFASVASNMDDDRMTVDEVLALPISLDEEISENGLTMKSELLKNLWIVEGKNCIGYNEDDVPTGYTGIYNKEVKLSRVIAAIYLKSLKVTDKKSNNCGNIVVKNIFLANVKGKATIAGEKDLEAKDNSYWAGAYENELGAYKKYKAVLKTNLLQAVVGNSNESTPIVPGGTWAGTANTFYVYPNTTGGEGCNTLLIVEATYNYNDGSSPETRFYRVPVNHKEFNGGDPYLVNSNYKYLIELEVGVGSPIPYDDLQDAHIGVKVTVAPWDVIIIEEPVD